MNEQLAAAGLTELPPSDDHGDETLGQVKVPWFGQQQNAHVIFELKSADQGPNDRQIDAFCSFMQNQSSFFPSLEKSLLDYYHEVRSEAEPNEELFPSVHTPEQLGPMTELTGILVGYYDGEDWSAYIGLLAECSWEEEHGLGIKVVGNQVTEIGFQDIVI